MFLIKTKVIIKQKAIKKVIFELIEAKYRDNRKWLEIIETIWFDIFELNASRAGWKFNEKIKYQTRNKIIPIKIESYIAWMSSSAWTLEHVAKAFG